MNAADINFIKTAMQRPLWDKATCKKIYTLISNQNPKREYRCFCDPQERIQFREKQFQDWYENNKNLFDTPTA